MTEFITRCCHAENHYEVIVKTDSKEYYKATQDFARRLIDHANSQTKGDCIRAMNDEKLAEFICGIYDEEEDNAKVINGYYIPCYNQGSIKEYLGQSAEEGENGI